MKYVLLLALLFPAYKASAAEGDGILRIFDQFAVVATVANKCIAKDQIDKNDVASHMANHRMILTMAHPVLKRRYPHRSDTEIAEAMKQRVTAVSSNTNAKVDKTGCETHEMERLIKLFHVQAKWKPTE